MCNIRIKIKSYVYDNVLMWVWICYLGSLSASRENTPPYRSVSYNPPGGNDAGNKPTVRSASWTSEAPIMPPLSVNVNLGPAAGMLCGQCYKNLMCKSQTSAVLRKCKN